MTSPLWNELRFGARAHAVAIIDRLEALAPAMLQAYPSTAFALAGLLEYGMAERVAFATECEHGTLHINHDYAYVEIIDGFVVGTTFHNQAMPLVRYRPGDRSRWKAGACVCGRAFPIIEPATPG